MSDNKLVKSIPDAATITGLVAGIGWIGKKVIKENLTGDPSASADELRQVHSRHGWQHRAEEIPGGPKDTPDQYVSAHAHTRESQCVVNYIYTKWRLIAIMVGGAVLNAATFIGGNYLAKYLSGDSGQAALDEKKRHDLALEKYQKDYAQYQKDRTQLLDWIAEQDREKNQSLSTVSKTQTQPWLCTTKLTEQRWLCHRSPSSLTTTNPARSRRMVSCCSLAPAPSPLAMRPFASCKTTLVYTRVHDGG